ncbi:Lactosylceramide alpha-2,3-sialyltransferase [Liparis tanakae]|uniref:Lactosylceramide alpha-2,3-sialyltransferase n=1 Tax=Liparis tanakae TaxID=230148 RepID=A0A4Z2ICZ7_9TELE|nr:Lactosylceramide alpha-2,3-sialyltransferase [Liparis tanakae]
MVTLNRVSVEAPDDGSPLLPEAAEAATPTPLFYWQQLIAETDSREFSLGRSKNLAFSLVLLIGCYSAILIPAYLPLDTVAALNDDNHHPEDLPGLPPSLREVNCRRCVVVGNGGVLHGSHLGSHIDQYDIIIRLNNAPVFGYEKDAGSHTTIRLIYPEAAPRAPNEYQNTTMVALVVFKSLDLDWLTSVITKQPLSFWSKIWFWREVVDDIPLRPENFRILHPEIIHKTGQVLQKYAQKPGNLCDQVSLAGFGYDLQHPEARLHYYETIRMDAIKAQVVHDVNAEKLFLRDLVAAGAVTDLTGAL